MAKISRQKEKEWVRKEVISKIFIIKDPETSSG